MKLVLCFEVNKKLLVQVFAKSLRNQNDSTETRSYKITEHNKGSHSDKRNGELSGFTGGLRKVQGFQA